MDPNAAWQEAVDIADSIWNGGLAEKKVEPDESRLAELVLSLHDWLKKGGFPPAAFVQKK